MTDFLKIVFTKKYMSERQIILEPDDEFQAKKPLTIWIGDRAKTKYRDIRERYKRAPIVEDLTRMIEERIDEWYQKVLETDT